MLHPTVAAPPISPARPSASLRLSSHRIAYWNLEPRCLEASLSYLDWAAAGSVAELNDSVKQSSDVFCPDVTEKVECHYPFQSAGSRYRVKQIPDFVDEVLVGFMLEVEKLSEEAVESGHLRADALKWRTIVQNAPDALVIANAEGQVEYLNTKAEDLFGYTAEELLKEPVEVLMPEQFRKQHPGKREGYTKSPHARPMGNLMLSGLKKDGSVFPVDVSLSPVHTPEGLLIATAFRDVSAQIEKEEQLALYHTALAEQSQKLERILDSISECFCTTDRDWNLQYWNSAAVRTMRRKSSEVLGKNIWSIFPQTETSLLFRMCTQVMLSRNSATFEHQNRYGKWYYNSVHPNEDGGITIYFKDITERKLREIELIEVRNNLSAVINATDSLIWSVDSKYRLLTSNMAFSKHFDESCDKAGIVYSSELADGVGEVWKMLYDRCMVGQSFGIEVEQLPNHYVRFHPIYGVNGAIAGAACHAVNTLQLTQLERANKATSAKFEALVQNGSDLIFILDKDNIVSYVSPSVQALLGISVESSISSLKGRVHRDDFHRLNRYIKCATATRNLKMEPFRFLSLEDKYVWIEASVDNLLENEDVAGLVFNASDISVHKQKEQEHKLLINELTRSNSDLMQYSFITSHNLRAPLSNIQGLLQHLDRDSLGAETAEVIEMVEEATQHLADTISDLSKILFIKNNTALAVEPLDLQVCFHTVNRNFLSVQNEIGTDVFLDFQASHAHFNVQYLESILTNLISNAIKYRHPDRKLIMRIESRTVPEGVMLTFGDNGRGINLERHRDRLFGMYQRFHSGIEGQGLGLFMVEAQMKALGGSIDVESEENVGTVFTLFMRDTSR